MSGVRKKRLKNGKYQGWYTDETGKRVFVTGTRSRRETELMMQHLEDVARQVRLGYRPPTARNPPAARQIASVMDEYLAWGTLQGGKYGRPWDAAHAKNRQFHLMYWTDALSLRTLRDLEGCLPVVEAAMRALTTQGKSMTTIRHYTDALDAFCLWCVEREYLPAHPLARLTRLAMTPVTRRRVLTLDEIHRLLAAAPAHRSLLYAVALCSGLRASELRALRVTDLDVDAGGLRLHAAWTKNRQDGFQPLPRAMVHRLHAWGVTGEAARRYTPRPIRGVPADALLYVSANPGREFAQDRTQAGIARSTAQGYVDFHALRTTYINLVIATGATIKEWQPLVRHARPELTMTRYAQSQDAAAREAVEKVGASLFFAPERAPAVHQQVVNAPEVAPIQDMGAVSGQWHTLPSPGTAPHSSPEPDTSPPTSRSHLRLVTDPGTQIPTTDSDTVAVSPQGARALCVHLVCVLAGWPVTGAVP